ncbi:MAG: DinB family protein [Candidatus Dormiibacterota bacterium]
MIVEVGPSRRTFARVVAWPGWCRSGRDERSAMAALEGARGRFGKVASAAGLEVPSEGFEIIERVAGTAVTDFGAIAVTAVADQRALSSGERERLFAMLRAAWKELPAAFDLVPPHRRDLDPARGRSPSRIVQHVLETELMHLAGMTGGRFRKPEPGDSLAQLAVVQEQLGAAFAATPLETVATPILRHGFRWTPRFVVHRSAWHALEHAWELEDRVVA